MLENMHGSPKLVLSPGARFVIVPTGVFYRYGCRRYRNRVPLNPNRIFDSMSGNSA